MIFAINLGVKYLKIVGIGGESASGKTTLSNLISSYDDDIEVIHLDNTLDEIKKVIVPNNGLRVAREGYEDVIALKNNPFEDIRNPVFNFVYFNLRRLIINGIVKRKLKAAKDEQFSIAIIEGASLEGINVSFDYLVKVQTVMPVRLNRWLERDNESYNDDEMNKKDDYTERLRGSKVLKYNRTIENPPGILHMDKVAKEIYDEIK